MIDLRADGEQRQIMESAAALLEASAPVSRLRDGTSGGDVHAVLAGWGWFGVGVPEPRGGIGLGIAEEVLLHFLAGRHLTPVSALASTLAAAIAAPEACAELLAGRRRAALAFSARDGRFFVVDREDAAELLLIEPQAVSLLPATAFAGRPIDAFDEQAKIEAGRLDLGRVVARAPAERALLLIAAMLAGMAGACRDLAVDYAGVREQFGQPVGAFQAVKHLCADMGLRAYAAEAQVKLAGATLADTPDAAPFQVAAALATAITAAIENAEAAIQVHGGIGFTAECDVHVFLKRAHLMTRAAGGRSLQLAALLAFDPPRLGAQAE